MFFKKKKEKPLPRLVDKEGNVTIGGVSLDALLGSKPLSKKPGPSKLERAVSFPFKAAYRIAKLPFVAISAFFSVLKQIVSFPLRVFKKRQ